MAFAAQARNGTISEMNITPLVDVMLVLLIIFMVATPMLTRTLTLDLPSFAPEPPPPPTEPIALQIRADGTLSWDGIPMPMVAIDAAMRTEAGREAPAVLQIEADPDAAYERVAEVMARARRAGLERIALD
jgi:biopolymer transport protein ExbD